jgi:uncharacterized protein YjbI with pentapeptide repeats
MPVAKDIEFVKNGRWNTRSITDGPLDLTRATLEGIQIGTWPNRIHEQMSRFSSGDAFYAARFAEATLSGASFQAVWLKNADFSGAKLNGARIEGSSFDDAKLRGTDLRSAVFALRALWIVDPPNDEFEIEFPTTLHRAIFASAQVEGCDFSGAEFDQTIILDTDLSMAQGLEHASHAGPSFLSQSTLQRSRGIIPTAFLQGIGLKDWEIAVVQLYRVGISDSERNKIVSRTAGSGVLMCI